MTESVQHAWLDPFPHRSRCLLYAGLALSVFLTESPFLTYSQSQAFHWRTQRLLNYYLADESASCGIHDDCHSKTLMWVSVILSLCKNCWIFTGRFEITFKNNVLHEFFYHILLGIIFSNLVLTYLSLIFTLCSQLFKKNPSWCNGSLNEREVVDCA